MSNVVPLKYVRKPLFVDAVQVTAETFTAVAEWCQGTIKRNDDVPVNWLQEGVEVDPENMYIHVRVHQPRTTKQTQARVGDWILYSEHGYKVYAERAFTKSFDLVNTGVTATPVEEKPAIEMTERERIEQIKAEAQPQPPEGD